MIFDLIDHYNKNTMDFGDNKLDRFKAKTTVGYFIH